MGAFYKLVGLVINHLIQVDSRVKKWSTTDNPASQRMRVFKVPKGSLVLVRVKICCLTS